MKKIGYIYSLLLCVCLTCCSNPSGTSSSIITSTSTATSSSFTSSTSATIYGWTAEQLLVFNDYFYGCVPPVINRPITKFSYFAGNLIIETIYDSQIAQEYSQSLENDGYSVSFDSKDQYYSCLKQINDSYNMCVSFYDENFDGVFQICMNLREIKKDREHKWTEEEKLIFVNHLESVELPFPDTSFVSIKYTSYPKNNYVYITGDYNSNVLENYLAAIENIGFVLSKHPSYGIDVGIKQLSNNKYIELWVAIADETSYGGGKFFEVFGYVRQGTKIVIDEKHVEFGSYPQTLVESNSELYSELYDLIDELPEIDDKKDWNVYEDFYVELEQCEYGFYKDIEYNTKKYRALYCIEPRTISAVQPLNDTKYGYQMIKNGYDLDTVYFFEFEPIIWKIMDDDEGIKTLAPEYILDNNYYSTVFEDFEVEEQTYHCSNYEQSFMRKWINSTFYNTAFSESEKSQIQITDVDNSITQCALTNEDWNLVHFYEGEEYLGPNYYETYISEDTSDKVFLFSRKELIDYDFGYDYVENWQDLDRDKAAKPGTDYALARGLLVYTSFKDSVYSRASNFYLRSPQLCDYYADSVHFSDWEYGLNYHSAEVVQCLGVYVGINVDFN